MLVGGGECLKGDRWNLEMCTLTLAQIDAGMAVPGVCAKSDVCKHEGKRTNRPCSSKTPEYVITTTNPFTFKNAVVDAPEPLP